MSERYEPPSDFLKAVVAEEVPLTDGEFADANLHQLIELTHDRNRANRDWAVLLLAQSGSDTPTVRAALLEAANDEDDFVRAEAVLGLANRDREVALPFVQAALKGDAITVPILEAAAICAHPSLIPDLRVWAEPSNEPYTDALAADALTACEQVGI
jgi:HEAT repeat protein